ncbi:anthranilate phosphoribosyltransferase [Corynebacterium anserum]|uniref:Anthranilate phosphoribosyltransferase n=1 Tax=Corynebacterium anserum TaxID=2684406 RepID=A0A7G7YMV8_9CORY|nr:anthranilate phosphoribosyltransferase [Corynebacterium anserum]QNH95828.1 anthranilate phosphoribosyltransferase [Corynebacterium anserum]
MATSQGNSSPSHRNSLEATQLPKSYFTWSGVLDRLGRRDELSESQVAWAMQQIMQGNATDAQIAAFSFGMRVKGITAAELASAAATMRSFATPVDFSSVPERVDIVGTGGDGHHTVNISTMASFVVAACGVPVVKHGNRAASSKCGGADMLEALGYNIVRAPEQVVKDAQTHNFAFLFAKTYHPAMRFAAPVRSELGVPTIFNLLGPLTNPASPRYGLIGCAFRDMMPIVGGAFAHQGCRVLVVRSMDGMDEISVSAPTEVVTVDSHGTTGEEIINPRELGLDFYSLDEVRGGDADFNADVARRFFRNEITGAIKDSVLINAAAALTSVHGWERDGFQKTMMTNIEVAREALESGKALTTMTNVVDENTP